MATRRSCSIRALRTRYRDGRMPDEIKMMTPGAPEKLTLDLWDTAITFEKGHRIAVHVTSSNYPRFDVNPNTGDNPGQGREDARGAATRCSWTPASRARSGCRSSTCRNRRDERGAGRSTSSSTARPASPAASWPSTCWRPMASGATCAGRWPGAARRKLESVRSEIGAPADAAAGDCRCVESGVACGDGEVDARS